ncbi:MAG TPA: kelch repeat-containing protein [Fibrobacteria bacterium]|nr:kelch repeat-containing protein [Fibrobacteria bacterium]
MSVPRSEMHGALIGDKVYVPGGYDSRIQVVGAHEVYDISNNRWSSAQAMPVAKEHHVVEACGSKLYAIKGETQIYDPARDSWSRGDSTPSRYDASSCVLDDRIYLIGGGTPGARRYSPASGAWEDLAPMRLSRGHHRSVVLNGRIYVLGGIQTSTSRQTGTVEIYDPANNQWSDGIPMRDKRSGFAAVAVGGRIIVAGGEKQEPGQSPAIVKSVEIFDGKAWSYLPEMPVGIHGAAYAAYGDKLYILGGSSQPYGVRNSGMVYILDLNSAVPVDFGMRSGRRLESGVLGNGTWAVFNLSGEKLAEAPLSVPPADWVEGLGLSPAPYFIQAMSGGKAATRFWVKP